MGLIAWGLGLIIIGLILGMTGFFGVAGVVQTIGWILLAVGVVLAIVYAVGRAGAGTTHRHP